MDWEEAQLVRFARITDRDVHELLRKSSTEYNFLEIQPKVEKVIESVNLLRENFEFWSQLPQQIRTEINSRLDELATVFDEMQTFDPKRDNAWGARNTLVERFQSYYSQFYTFLIEKLNAYLGLRAYNQELSSKFGQEAKSELAEIRKIRREIDRINKGVQEAATIASKTASTATASSFDGQATEHKGEASRWFWGIICFGAVALLIALSITYQVIQEIVSNRTVFDSAEASLFKIAVLAFLYIGIRFAMRMYSAHKHLYTVNKHRANILKAMDAYRSGASDESTKDKILLAAVGVAFSQTETGFLTTKEGAGSDESDIIDIVNLASKK